MFSLALLAYSQTKHLNECSVPSILGCVMKSAQVGLEFNTPQQFAWLIPRKNGKTGGYECHFEIGYRGLAELAMRSGIVKAMSCELVYENDFFEIEFGENRRVVHKPNIREDRGKVIGCYSVANLGDDVPCSIEWMTTEQINEVRDKSSQSWIAHVKENWKESPWDDSWGEMARKTVTKRHCKRLPNSTEDQRLALAVAHDNAQERPDLADYNMMEVTATETRTDALLGVLSQPEETPEAETMGPPLTPAAFKKTVKACGVDLSKFEERYAASVDDWGPEDMLDAMAILERIGNGQTYDEAAA